MLRDISRNHAGNVSISSLFIVTNQTPVAVWEFVVRRRSQVAEKKRVVRDIHPIPQFSDQLSLVRAHSLQWLLVGIVESLPGHQLTGQDLVMMSTNQVGSTGFRYVDVADDYGGELLEIVEGAWRRLIVSHPTRETRQAMHQLVNQNEVRSIDRHTATT